MRKKPAPAVERAKAIWARFVNLKAEPHMNDQETPQPGAEECPPEEELVETPEAILAERDQLLTDKTDLQNTLLRHAAEFDNFRKRTERERADLFEYAAADAVAALLPVLDDLERALKVQTNDTDYVKGIELIYQRMFEVLAKLGLQPIEAEGSPSIRTSITPSKWLRPRSIRTRPCWPNCCAVIPSRAGCCVPRW